MRTSLWNRIRSRWRGRCTQPRELSVLLSGIDPDLVFLDLSEWDIAMEAASYIREKAPRTGIIGFGAGWESDRQAQGAAAGVSAMLVAPVTVGARSMTGAGSVVTKDVPPDSLVAGVPAKVKKKLN